MASPRARRSWRDCSSAASSVSSAASRPLAEDVQVRRVAVPGGDLHRRHHAHAVLAPGGQRLRYAGDRIVVAEREQLHPRGGRGATTSAGEGAVGADGVRSESRSAAQDRASPGRRSCAGSGDPVSGGRRGWRGGARSGSAADGGSATAASTNEASMRFAIYGLIFAALLFVLSGGHILFLPLFFLLPLGGMFGHRQRHGHFWYRGGRY